MAPLNVSGFFHQPEYQLMTRMAFFGTPGGTHASHFPRGHYSPTPIMGARECKWDTQGPRFKSWFCSLLLTPYYIIGRKTGNLNSKCGEQNPQFHRKYTVVIGKGKELGLQCCKPIAVDLWIGNAFCLLSHIDHCIFFRT
jgi:hypothetical protein